MILYVKGNNKDRVTINIPVDLTFCNVVYIIVLLFMFISNVEINCVPSNRYFLIDAFGEA